MSVLTIVIIRVRITHGKETTAEGVFVVLNPQIQMLIAGFCIATWQILVNASGFPGPVANLWVLALSAVIAVLTAATLTTLGNIGLLGAISTILFAAVVVVFRSTVPASAVAYVLAASAGALSGIAVWQLNDALARVPVVDVGGLLVLMMTAQIATASMYHIGAQAYLAGTFSLRTAVAFGLAVLAGLLLPR